MRHAYSAVALALCAVCGSAFSADVYVSPTGNDANPGTAAMPLASIGAAVAAATAGDTIHLAPGTYNGPQHRAHEIDFDLTFVGDGPRGGVVISGSGPPAGDIGRFLTVDDADIVIENIHFDSMRYFGPIPATGAGTVAFMTGGSIRLVGCDITNNRSFLGPSPDGGVVYADGADVEFDDCTFSGDANGPPGQGGDQEGSICFIRMGTLTITDTVIQDNIPGVIFYMINSSTVITGSTFSNNGSRGPVLYGRTDVSQIDPATVDILDSTFVDNDASKGGGFFSDGSIVPVLQLQGFDDITIGRSVFAGNVGVGADSDAGCGGSVGVFSVSRGGPLLIFNSVFYANRVAQLCTPLPGFTSSNAGVGSYRVPDGTLRLVNSTVVGHDNAFLVSYFFEEAQPEFLVQNSVFADNNQLVVVDEFATITYANSIADGGAPAQPGLTIADPMLVDIPATPGSFEDADLRLAPGSPAIDAGNNTFLTGHPAIGTYDLDGNDRVVDGNGDGTATVDIGAYEYQGLVFCGQADLNGDGFLNNTDINLFVLNFGAMGPLADFNADGNWNNTDINLFVSAFLAGCD